MASTAEKTNVGKLTQVIGPVVDVEFTGGKMPQIYSALKIEGKNEAGQDVSVTCEVQQLLGDNQVRAVAMSTTDGLVRGMDVIDLGAPISVPVGTATLGRIFNVLGEAVDQQDHRGRAQGTVCRVGQQNGGLTDWYTCIDF